MKRIKGLELEVDRLNGKLNDPEMVHGQLSALKEQYEMALQTIGEQQERILCIGSDLFDLRHLYHEQLCVLKQQIFNKEN
jgi:hypothetical protein